MNTLRTITYIYLLILQLCVHNSLSADFEAQPIRSDKPLEVSIALTSPPLIVNEFTSLVARTKDPIPPESNIYLPTYHWFINGVPQFYSLINYARIFVHSTGEYNFSVVVQTSAGNFSSFIIVTVMPDTPTLEPIQSGDSVQSGTSAPIESMVDVQEKVEGIAVTYDHTVGYDSTSSLTGNVKIVVRVEKGTDLTYQFNFMDGNDITEIRTKSKSVTIYHTFVQVGNNIQICVKNDISVICRIVHMQFDVLITDLKWDNLPSIVKIYTPYMFSTTIASGTNVEYSWFFGWETSNDCSEWFCYYTFEDNRRYRGYVEAYNLASWQRIHFSIDIDLRNQNAAISD